MFELILGGSLELYMTCMSEYKTPYIHTREKERYMY